MKQAKYNSPYGELTIVADEKYLYALFFSSQVHYYGHYNLGHIRMGSNPIIRKTVGWLAKYFKGKKVRADNIPIYLGKYKTQKKILSVLKEIPYGEEKPYQQIVEMLESDKIKQPNLLNAIKYFIEHNPILLIVPSHRVKDIKEYPCGIERKNILITYEKSKKFNL